MLEVSSLGSAFLASSCCLVQIALTLSGRPCAGLRPYLHPHRGAFSLGWILPLLWCYFRHRRLKRVALIGALSFLVAQSEVIVKSVSPDFIPLDSRNYATVAMEITGMSCETCRGRVLGALRRVRGAVGAAVDLNAKTAVVYFEYGTKPPSDEVLDAVISLNQGYGVSLLPPENGQ